MSQYDFGVIDPTATQGVDLPDILGGFRDAVHSGHLGAARPAYVQAGMIWNKNVSATAIEVYFYDGAADIHLFTINPTTNKGSIAASLLSDLAHKMTPRDFTAASGVLGLADVGAGVAANRPTANELVIQSNNTTPIPATAYINVFQTGAGKTTVRAETGVMLNGVDGGNVSIAAQWLAVMLWQVAADNWIATGLLSNVSWEPMYRGACRFIAA